MLFITKPRGLKARKTKRKAQSDMRVWSGKPLFADPWTTADLCIFCMTSGSSLMAGGGGGEGGDKGAGAGDKDGSLVSDRGGVNSPQTKSSRRFCLCAAIFKDMFSAFNLVFEFCRNLNTRLRQHIAIY